MLRERLEISVGRGAARHSSDVTHVGTEVSKAPLSFVCTSDRKQCATANFAIHLATFGATLVCVNKKNPWIRDENPAPVVGIIFASERNGEPEFGGVRDVIRGTENPAGDQSHG